MRISAKLFAMLGFSLLVGCGGGSSSVTTTADNRDNGNSAGVYTVTDLGAENYYGYGYYGYGGYSPYYGLFRSSPISINSNGDIVSGQGGRAAYWQNGTLTYLSDYSYSTANALNDSEQFVGQSPASQNGISYYAQHAALWQKGTVTDLGTLPDGYYSNALAVNDTSDVAGESSTGAPNYGWHAALWQNGTVSDLGTLGGDYSRAVSVNHSLQAVGWSTLTATSTGNYYSHAFVWQNGKITDLGTLPGGNSSDASAINDSGVIVGSSNTTPVGLFGYSGVRAVVWRNGVISDLGTLGGPGGIAFGINNAGAIVGAADTAAIDTTPQFFYPYSPAGNNSGASNGGSPPPGGGSTTSSNPISAGASGNNAATRSAKAVTRGIGDTYVSHAFLYTNNQMVDLNTLTPGNSGWELVQATGINAQGQIVGYGVLNKKTHAFLLTPK